MGSPEVRIAHQCPALGWKGWVSILPPYWAPEKGVHSGDMALCSCDSSEEKDSYRLSMYPSSCSWAAPQFFLEGRSWAVYLHIPHLFVLLGAILHGHQESNFPWIPLASPLEIHFVRNRVCLHHYNWVWAIIDLYHFSPMLSSLDPSNSWLPHLLALESYLGARPWPPSMRDLSSGHHFLLWPGSCTCPFTVTIGHIFLPAPLCDNSLTSSWWPGSITPAQMVTSLLACQCPDRRSPKCSGNSCSLWFNALLLGPLTKWVLFGAEIL